jgi:hypothetical protein
VPPGVNKGARHVPPGVNKGARHVPPGVMTASPQQRTRGGTPDRALCLYEGLGKSFFFNVTSRM